MDTRRSRTLVDGWTARRTDAEGPSYDAIVPGCVHADLLRHGAIPDPFVDANEVGVQWVGRSRWTYRNRFELSADDLAFTRTDLVFDGLDTLASITLNGVEVANTENMHRRYRLDVSTLVVEGSNELTVAFESAELEAERRRAELGHMPCASFDQPYPFLRKMACAWGWDWGPTLNTCGIWRPARLESWDTIRLAAVRPTTTIDDADHGTVRIVADLERTAPGRAQLEAALTDPDGGVVATGSVGVSETTDRVVVDLNAAVVARWWPRTMGDQPLYTLTVGVVDPDGRRLDEHTSTIGFRTIELDTQPDEIGTPFTLVVNGVPIFTRGLNWIPDDPLVARVDRARIADRLTTFCELGADLLRVWGGGIYESDEFYELCDELGILVWQDFPFACAAYPEELLAGEIEAEARDNITRLMSHPSLAIWNGNNENFMGWFEWDWQPQLGGRRWGSAFYLDVLPALVAELDPSRPYWPGSPYSGTMQVDTTDDRHGCRHLWDVWNQVDYRRYRDHVPRFVSEFGWQAPAARATIDRWITDDPLLPDSPAMLHHQKALDGQGKLSRGLAPFFDEPTDTASWLWAMQLNQARAITTVIEHFRSHRGTCMGTVWWQFNDCWPVTSWAVLDSDGRRKPAFYALRAAFHDRLLTIQPRRDELAVAAVNDGPDPWFGRLRIRRVRFDGSVLSEHRRQVEVPARSVKTTIIPGELAECGDPASEVLVAELDGQRAYWFFQPDRLLAFDRARVDLDVISDGDRHEVRLTARTLVRDLTLLVDHAAPDATVDRQLVTLLPGESVDLVVDGVTAAGLGQLRQAPVLRSANDLVADRPTAGAGATPGAALP